VDPLDSDLLAACADAGLAEASVRLYRFPGPDDVRGSFVPPHTAVGLHPRLTREQAADVAARTDCYRIAVQSSPELVFAALFRHELEHCAQWSTCGLALFSLTEALDNAFVVRHGPIRGVNWLRYIGPMEGDANAAASAFATERFGREACAEFADTEHGLLFEPIEELPDRTSLAHRQACFAAVAGETLEAVLGGPPGPLLEQLATGAAAVWSVACGDPLVRSHSERAIAATPTQESTCAADSVALKRAWQAALDETRLAFFRAMQINGLLPK
jgi:hypothetical protein